jgi:hypothetical protein
MQGSTLVVFLLSLALLGCVSLSSSSPTPPNSTTVVVPQNK